MGKARAVLGRQGVAALAGAHDDLGIPQGFPDAREQGWSRLSLLSCSFCTSHSGEALGGAHSQLAHSAFPGDARWAERSDGEVSGAVHSR